ncbi:MAG TPA: hypothetical protein PLN21_03510 [Gemmatales bacterium]|nr:hypothetical protein [Gemmatales bacterium]
MKNMKYWGLFLLTLSFCFFSGLGTRPNPGDLFLFTSYDAKLILASGCCWFGLLMLYNSLKSDIVSAIEAKLREQKMT